MPGAAFAAEVRKLKTTEFEKGLRSADCKLKNENCKLQIDREECGVKVIIRLSEEEELKALPLLLRHSAGMILPNRTYVLLEEGLSVLRARGIRYSVIAREAVAATSPV
jgi:hypothetical protein